MAILSSPLMLLPALTPMAILSSELLSASADRFEPAPTPNAILRLPTTFCPVLRPIAIRSVRSLVWPCTLFTPALSPIEMPPVVAAIALRPNATAAT